MTAEARNQLQETYYPGYSGEAESSQAMTLDSLQDPPPGTKPRYPYSTLIRYAIKGSPNERLLLEDIYYALEARFPYFRTAPSGWKNSVRHNLSLNPCFIKVPRPLTDRGKGSYWALDESVDPRTGVHRIRKKRGHSERGVEASGSGAGGSGADHYGGQYQYMQYMHPVDQNGNPYGYGFHPAFMPPVDLDPSDPSVVSSNKSYYRDLWLSDLNRLEDYTKEMDDKGSADIEFWRMMYTRLYRAFAPDPPMYAQPPPGMHPGMDGSSMHDPQHGSDDKDVDGDLDDEE
ncbi:hypothetical protein CPB86DRAFT_782581 [Serendipita vermifera]|nr:hypothetical protein CPB86DRAFT_782581 [Serendipita vermifera]